MLSKLAIFLYGPLLFLQHVHDYLQCQNRYNMSVLPRMKCKNKISDMWIDWDRLPEIWTYAQLTSAEVQPMTYDPAGHCTKP